MGLILMVADFYYHLGAMAGQLLGRIALVNMTITTL